MNVVEEIRAFNAERDPERLQLKYRAMRASTFAFLRGSCHIFYGHLPWQGVFKSAPLVWVCGDLHLENFGSYKGDNRLVYFDINDFDEAALAPASWDLVRMLTSLRVAADGVSIKTSDAEHLCACFLDAYAMSLTAGKSYWIERDTSEGLVKTLLGRLTGRNRCSFLDARTEVREGNRKLRVDGRKALGVTKAQRALVASFMREFAQAQTNPPFYRVIDVARRIAGTGSLGVDRYSILVQGKGSPDQNYLLDLKEALPSALAARVNVKQPRWQSEASRVVTIQRRMQAVSMAFLQPVLLAERPFVLRALQPSEDRVTLRAARQGTAEMRRLVQSMGRLLAWGQLRSSGRQGSVTADELEDFGHREKWKRKLLEASQACAAQVRSDAIAFNAAYDVGAFGPLPESPPAP
jgi:uncharacterized protein (DUF2252 family)